MTPPLMPSFEHWRLVRRHLIEVERFRSLLRLAARDPSVLHHLRVEHDDNERCCRREPWPTTMASLLSSEESA